jgi:hypothetical protein
MHEGISDAANGRFRLSLDIQGLKFRIGAPGLLCLNGDAQ